jgi:hypothetical protein
VDLAAAATRTPRWHEYGRPTTPVKVGRWPPASGGLKALTGIVVRPSLATKRGSTETCGLLKHASQFTFTEPNLTQTIGHPPASNGLITVYCLCGRLPARRSLVSPTVLKRSAHPSGRRSLLAETKSLIVPFGCASFHLEYKWWTNIPPAHPPKIPRNVWCFICPAIPPSIAPCTQPIALAG